MRERSAYGCVRDTEMRELGEEEEKNQTKQTNTEWKNPHKKTRMLSQSIHFHGIPGKCVMTENAH